MREIEFELGFHWDKKVQFDLIVHRASDRVYRFIECKWTNDSDQILDLIKSFKNKIEEFDFKIQKVICLNHNPSSNIKTMAQNNAVVLITPDDLF